jgi:hypothetical protein
MFPIWANYDLPKSGTPDFGVPGMTPSDPKRSDTASDMFAQYPPNKRLVTGGYSGIRPHM